MRRPSPHPPIALGLAVLAFVILAGIAQAQTANEKFRTGNDVTIPADETVGHDLYAFAGSVHVAGTVDGDLVASGGTVDVTGTVTGDVIAAGGNVSINGTVDGDARIAGGALSVGGTVAEDLLATGGQVALAPTGSIGEDMVAASGRLTIDGAVAGNLLASTGAYQKSGTVGGTEDVRIATVPAGGAIAAAPTTADMVVNTFQHFLIVLLAGAIMLWLAPRAYAATTTAVQRRPLPAAGWGLVGLLGYVVVLILIVLAMVVFGIIFALVGFEDLVGLDVLGGVAAILGVTTAFVVITGYLADAIVGAALAGLVMRSASTTRTREFGILAIGAAVVVVLSAIPVIGPVVKLVVVVLGLGAVLMAFMDTRRSRPEATTDVPAPAMPAMR
jgi:cytoskeletal protein CcmA (bactofilin family)